MKKQNNIFKLKHKVNEEKALSFLIANIASALKKKLKDDNKKCYILW